MSPSSSPSRVDLTSEQEASLLTPLSTLPTSSTKDDDAHAHRKRYYSQLSKSEKDGLSIRDPSRPPIFSFSPWLYEILSLSLAFFAIAALIVLLAWYDKKPNPRWATQISLNAIVSTVSVLFRMSVMVPITKCISQLSWIWLAKAERPLRDVALFDQASRGVLGGLTILASSRHVTSFVSIGAILTIAMLAVGPCFQQTVVYYGAQVIDETQSAYTSAAFGYNGSTISDDRYVLPGRESWLPFNMKSAVLTGLLSSRMITKPDPLFFCPSGNCTWDTFDTLAVESKCIDAPEEASLECHTNPDPESSRPTRCYITWNETTSQKGGKSLSRLGTYAPFNASISLSTPFFFGSHYAGRTSDLDASVWNIPPLDHLDIEWVRATHLSFDGVWYDMGRNSSLESRMCKLYTVVQKVSATARNGVYKEEIEQVSTSAEISSQAINFKYQDGSSPPDSISLTKDQNAILFFGVMVLALSGNVSLGIEGALVGGEVHKMLYQSPNITESIHSLAHYMSILLRSNDSILHNQEQGGDTSETSPTYIAPTHRVKGNVYVEKLHVAVRWVWLTLPALVALLTVLLLIITILQSHSQKVGIWKDSSLALLLYSVLEPGCRQKSAPASTKEAVERDAKGLGAVLVHREDGERGVKGSVKVQLR